MLNWVISSSVLILAIIILRKLFKGKISLRLQYGLWLVVAIRLLVPGTFGTSSFSVEHLTDRLLEKLPERWAVQETEFDIVADTKEITSLAKQDVNADSLTAMERNVSFPERISSIEEMQPEGTELYYSSDFLPAEATKESVKTEADEAVEASQKGTMQALGATKPAETPQTKIVQEYGKETDAKLDGKQLFSGIWMAGAVLMTVIFLVSNGIFRKQVKESRRVVENEYTRLPVYASGCVETPCLFGVLGTQIYITEDVAKDATLMRHSICHEMTHYRHGDLVWSLIRCICLVLHWYNPLVWWAAVLSKQDAELLCDEATILNLGENERLAYGRTLIQLTCKKPQTIFVASTTMSAGKKSVKERVMHIGRKPKTRIYAMALVLVLSLTTVGCTFTEADMTRVAAKQPESKMEEVIPGQEENIVTVEEKAAEETAAVKERYDAKGRRIITLYDTHQVLGIERWFYNEFNRTNKEYKIEIIDSEKYPLASLVNGENCPDVILTLDWENIGYWQEKGYLADLTPYLNASNVLKKENLLEESLEQFSVGDGIYGLPQGMVLDTMLVSESLLNGTTQWSVDTFLDWLEENPQLTVTGGPVSRKEILEYCLLGNLDAYVDLEQGTAAFHTDEFGRVLERIKNLKIDEMEDVVFLELQPGATCLVSEAICCSSEISIVETLTGENLVAMGYPNDKGEVRSNILSSKTFAILQNSSCKEGAIAFIEAYFAEELDDRADRDYDNGFLYTLQSETDAKGELPYDTYFTYSGSSEDKTGIKQEYTITQEQVDKYLGLYEGAQVDTFEKAYVRSLIMGVADEYFRFNKPLEKTCEEIQMLVNEYLEEKEA